MEHRIGCSRSARMARMVADASLCHQNALHSAYHQESLSLSDPLISKPSAPCIDDDDDSFIDDDDDSLDSHAAAFIRTSYLPPPAAAHDRPLWMRNPSLAPDPPAFFTQTPAHSSLKLPPACRTRSSCCSSTPCAPDQATTLSQSMNFATQIWCPRSRAA
jgi:hypothetical protein